MKLVRFDGETTGLLVEAGTDPVVLDVLASAGALDDPGKELLERLLVGGSWLGLIDEWADAYDALAALEAKASAGDVAVRALDGVTLEAPLVDPTQRVWAMGGNFAMHVDESIAAMVQEMPDSIKEAGKEGIPPWGFYVIPGTIVGPDTVISPPSHIKKLDYECEVAAVLSVDPDGSAPTIWGYTAWNDFSIRDEALGLAKIDHGPLTWSMQKNFDTANACGPCLVVGPGADANKVDLSLKVNGEVRQSANSSEMTYSFLDIAAHVADYLTLRNGDTILSGSPSGPAVESGIDGPYLKDGDTTIVTVEGVGDLVNEISMPANP